MVDIPAQPDQQFNQDQDVPAPNQVQPAQVQLRVRRTHKDFISSLLSKLQLREKLVKNMWAAMTEMRRKQINSKT
jgi:hypothetical protein